MTLYDFIEELDIAIKQDGHDIYMNADSAIGLKNMITKYKDYENMTEIKEHTTQNVSVEEDKEWLVIKFKDGEIAKYPPNEYTDYYYDKVCFVVIRDKQWIGIYNIDEIKRIEVVDGDESNISRH